jgi:replicative DNA helicase
MGYFEQLKQEIDRGKLGLNTGLPMGDMDKLLAIVPNIQQRTYYLVAGETGGGKSAFALNSFLYNPFSLLRASNPLGLTFKVFMWALEIPMIDIIAKAVCRKLYFQHNYVVDVNFVLSKGKNRITDEVYTDAMKLFDFYSELENIFHIFPPENPTGVYNTMKKYAENHGTIKTKPINIGTEKTPNVINVFDEYIPDNPNEYIIIIIDHVGLLRTERGYDTKQNIDKMSEYMVELRNNFSYIPVMVQQISRAMSTTDRFKLKRVEPQLSDLKQTANTQEDANIIFTLFGPARYDMEEHNGYNVTQLRDRYRWLSILKNRDGEADVGLGLNFIGEVGVFKELPAANIMELSGYEPYTQFNKIENLVTEEEDDN